MVKESRGLPVQGNGGASEVLAFAATGLATRAAAETERPTEGTYLPDTTGMELARHPVAGRAVELAQQ